MLFAHMRTLDQRDRNQSQIDRRRGSPESPLSNIQQDGELVVWDCCIAVDERGVAVTAPQ